MRRRLAAWVPPAAIALLRRQPRHVWRGVYRRFADVPNRGETYNSARLAEMTVSFTRDVSLRPEAHVPRDGGLLAMLASSLARPEQPVRIVDFGGGAGVDYILLRHVTRGRPFALDYLVIDHEVTCAQARALHRDGGDIRFAPSLDEVTAADIVHASASLPYVEDWRAMLARLFGFGATYVMISNVMVGTAPTFVTGQYNLGSSTVPYWFFGRQDLLAVADTARYRLALEVRTGADYDQTNFPAELRPGRAHNLVFAR